jgi:hypothetical protein
MRRRLSTPATDDRLLVATGVSGAVLTLLVIVVPFLSFAYDNASLHLALETGEGLIAALLAHLAIKRHRATGKLQHALLAWVFAVLAFTNLVLSAGPLVAERGRPGGWFTWATLGLRLVAAAALVAIPYIARRRDPSGTRLGWAILLLTGGTLVTVALGAAAADAWLAEPVGPLVSPADVSDPWEVGHPLVVATQLLSVGLYAGAAAGFTRQARSRPTSSSGGWGRGRCSGPSRGCTTSSSRRCTPPSSTAATCSGSARTCCSSSAPPGRSTSTGVTRLASQRSRNVDASPATSTTGSPRSWPSSGRRPLPWPPAWRCPAWRDTSTPPQSVPSRSHAAPWMRCRGRRCG